MRAKKIPVPLLPPITAHGKALMSTTDVAISEDEAEDLIDDEMKRQESGDNGAGPSLPDDTSSLNKKSHRTTRMVRRKIKVKKAPKPIPNITPAPVPSGNTSAAEE
jgi:hypothetical protein